MPLLQDYVTKQADRRPEALAVVTGDSTLTYGQLEARSNQLARVLREAGSRTGSPVSLLAPKSAGAIAAIVGIYKAGCIYVPLDPGSPAARLKKIVESCEPWCVLATRATSSLAHELSRASRRTMPLIGWLDQGPSSADVARPAFDLSDILAAAAEPVPNGQDGRRPAHILFTSGSTGTPKGVVITHANVIHFADWGIRYFGIAPGDRQSGHSPLHFDLSLFDIFGTFGAGATLYPVPPELSLFPNRLADFIRTHELAQWFSVPSLLTYMAALDVVRANDFPCLKRLLWCGEVLPTRALMHWMQRLPHVTFTNLYGPTETTIASSYYTVPTPPEYERETIPIGKACPGERLLVLDAELQPVQPETVGDLYISGVGLSPGYWQNAAATRAAFLGPSAGFSEGSAGSGGLEGWAEVEPVEAFESSNLLNTCTDRLYRTGDLASIGADGLAYFHGRADSQVKSRGYRIELGEVEAALHSLGVLDDCAVVAIASEGFEGAALCCAYVPADGKELTPAMLRGQLGQLLPTYMIPTAWLAFDMLPKNGNGKVDRGFLTTEFTNRATHPTRQRLAH